MVKKNSYTKSSAVGEPQAAWLDRQTGEQGSAEAAEVSQEKQVERDSMGRLLPGSTANRTGRPRKGRALTELQAQFMERPLSELRQIDLESVPAKEAIAIQQILASVPDSDLGLRNRSYTIDQQDGKAIQAVVHSDADEAQRDMLAGIAAALAAEQNRPQLPEPDSGGAEADRGGG